MAKKAELFTLGKGQKSEKQKHLVLAIIKQPQYWTPFKGTSLPPSPDVYNPSSHQTPLMQHFVFFSPLYKEISEMHCQCIM